MSLPTAQDLDRFISGGYAHLHCAKDGEYVIGKVGEPPTCSVPGHVLVGFQSHQPQP